MVGAKMGANVHSHEAMLGDVQPALPQVNGMLGNMGLRLAIGLGLILRRLSPAWVEESLRRHSVIRKVA
jgi:hypothetical protein